MLRVFSGSYLDARSVPCFAVYDLINPLVVAPQLPFHLGAEFDVVELDHQARINFATMIEEKTGESYG